MLSKSDQTPCGVMFSVFKRAGGIKHRELAELVLSERPLPAGRSPLELSRDRTWLSHSVVHAPVGTLQKRLFRDFGAAAVRVMGRLKSRRGNAMSAEEIVSMVAGEPGRAMERALELCHQDVRLYRNALERIACGEGLAPGERAEAALVLFVAVGCTADVRGSVAYTSGYERTTLGCLPGTPAVTPVRFGEQGVGAPRRETRLGLMRVEDGYVAGDAHWLSRSSDGTTVGALAMGSGDVTDVGAGVSGTHLRVWFDEKDGWLAEDLGSKNGTVLVSGATRESSRLEAGVPAALLPGDELVLAGTTTFVAVEGVVG